MHVYCVGVCVCVCSRARVCVCIYMYTHMYIYINKSINHTYIHTCIYVFMCVLNICVYASVYAMIPVRQWKMRTPTAQMSVRVEMSAPEMVCSGAKSAQLLDP
jgi:hypothetical protein